MIVGLLPAAAGAQQPAAPVYSVAPPEIPVPSDADWGKVRRIIQPFRNWTLICDDNTRTRSQICNVSQVILDQKGRIVFAWTLAASRGGDPLMNLRAPPTIGPDRTLHLNFPSEFGEIQIKLDNCDQQVCMTWVPVAPKLRRFIDKGDVASIWYLDRDGQIVEFAAPFEGLSDAVKSLK